ncbi:IS66 family insertion sequence element accessory protein TnpB [Caballeronia arationis]|uniref:IS66 family insertion sequence element accessory protein TnpB n=1 Tax=Caballeronia arationis TaxID=1777142 RepID=UPI002E0EA91B
MARENGINVNMRYTWRRRYLAEQQAPSTGLLPAVLLSDAPTQVVASFSGDTQALDMKPASHCGTIEIRIGLRRLR